MNRNALLKKGLLLEYATLGWNVFECAIVLYSSILAHSIALLGFGIDSVIEILASIVVVWQLKRVNKDKEKFAEKLIGAAFLLLAVYIFFQSLFALISHNHPQPSPLGMISLLLTAIAMFSLAYAKGKVGKKLDNPVLIKEAKVTLIDGLLATSVLIGISLNAFLGFWWADPLAGLIIVYYGFKEGLHVADLR